MRKFGICIWKNLEIWYNHYLSSEFINNKNMRSDFKMWYPLSYDSRKFDKPAIKCKEGSCFWFFNDKCHRIGSPAMICSDGSIEYWENGEKII